MQARSYCLYCTYLPSSLGQIDDLRALRMHAAICLPTEEGATERIHTSYIEGPQKMTA